MWQPSSCQFSKITGSSSHEIIVFGSGMAGHLAMAGSQHRIRSGSRFGSFVNAIPGGR
jgi:hypothetical protein